MFMYSCISVARYLLKLKVPHLLTQNLICLLSPPMVFRTTKHSPTFQSQPSNPIKSLFFTGEVA